MFVFMFFVLFEGSIEGNPYRKKKAEEQQKRGGEYKEGVNLALDFNHGS
jgi:hypothetical protein